MSQNNIFINDRIRWNMYRELGVLDKPAVFFTLSGNQIKSIFCMVTKWNLSSHHNIFFHGYNFCSVYTNPSCYHLKFVIITQYFSCFEQNQIKCIENLECLTSLRFLTLSGNQIEAVEGLKHLQQLFFLDLSLNLIKDFDIGKINVHGLMQCTYLSSMCSEWYIRLHVYTCTWTDWLKLLSLPLIWLKVLL